jgi:hypothetical protein
MAGVSNGIGWSRRASGGRTSIGVCGRQGLTATERRHRGRRAEACSDGAGGSRGAGEEASGAQHGCEVLRGWTAGRLVESAVH